MRYLQIPRIPAGGSQTAISEETERFQTWQNVRNVLRHVVLEVGVDVGGVDLNGRGIFADHFGIRGVVAAGPRFSLGRIPGGDLFLNIPIDFRLGTFSRDFSGGSRSEVSDIQLGLRPTLQLRISRTFQVSGYVLGAVHFLRSEGVQIGGAPFLQALESNSPSLGGGIEGCLFNSACLYAEGGQIFGVTPETPADTSGASPQNINAGILSVGLRGNLSAATVHIGDALVVRQVHEEIANSPLGRLSQSFEAYNTLFNNIRQLSRPEAITPENMRALYDAAQTVLTNYRNVNTPHPSWTAEEAREAYRVAATAYSGARMIATSYNQTHPQAQRIRFNLTRPARPHHFESRGPGVLDPESGIHIR